MTNSRKGLTGRLQQFDSAINGKSGHGGAARFRNKHTHYQMLVEKLYVAVSDFEFDVIPNNSDVLRQMRDVPKFEYDCLANYVEKFVTS
jgi:hypothetical protein